jgi:outer membrane protein assembly factor BamB
MIDQGAVYLGNPLNSTIQSYDLLTGTLRWSTPVTDSDPSVRLAPRAAPVLAQGKLIFPVAQHIFTLDPASGTMLNDYYSPYPYAAYGLNQPVVVGNQVYLSSVSGWVHYIPLSTLLTQPQPPAETVPALALKTAEYYDASAQPSSSQTTSFPTQWLSYAGDAAHTGYSATGPTLSRRWSAALPNSLSLSGAPQGEALYGSEVATQMTHLNNGVGSGVSPAAGRLFVAGNNRTVNAYNATTGKLIWRFRTNNHNMGQPLVIPGAVLVAGGNLGLNLGNYGSFIKASAQTRIGSGFMYIHALDPVTGNEKWTFYAGQGTLSSTPLYHNGVLYWVDGQSKVWAISATTGQPVAPFMDAAGHPLLSLGGGFNALSSANVYQDTLGRTLMIVGLAMPNRIVAVDLATATIAWTQDLIGFPSHFTGFTASSPAVDQGSGLIVGSVIADTDMISNTARVLVYALDGNTGNMIWTQRLDAGSVPSGFVAPTPMLANNRVHIANPLAGQVQALDVLSGASLWKTTLTTTAGRYAWGPAALLGSSKLLQPAGSALYTLNLATGGLLKTYTPGGAFTYTSATVLGKTVYIGNSYGWVLGLTFADVGG